MKIIVDIPEKLVVDGFERPFTEEERDVLIKAIGNGIPLTQERIKGNLNSDMTFKKNFNEKKFVR